MGHSKLPWKTDNHISVIADPSEVPIATMYPYTSLLPNESYDTMRANAKLIVTAVNVMPEMIDFLIDLLNQDLSDSMTKKNIDLLEKLSGVKLCHDCGAELTTKNTYGPGGDECWDWCPECERSID